MQLLGPLDTLSWEHLRTQQKQEGLSNPPTSFSPEAGHKTFMKRYPLYSRKMRILISKDEGTQRETNFARIPPVYWPSLRLFALSYISPALPSLQVYATTRPLTTLSFPPNYCKTHSGLTASSLSLYFLMKGHITWNSHWVNVYVYFSLMSLPFVKGALAMTSESRRKGHFPPLYLCYILPGLFMPFYV
jgi:hypothetical protein